MKELTPKQISDNYDKLRQVIYDYIESPRKEKLLELYNKKEDLIALAPASGKEAYHNCYPGGYVEHVLNVVERGLEVNDLWDKSGINDTHTKEELVFALLNHDLGKIGEGDQPYYIPNPSEWHRKNQGAIYTQNPKINFMPVQDRSLFILQEHGIECSFNEYVAIKTHDGLYDDANKAYYISFSDDGKFRTNLPFIVHQADFIAARMEYLEWKRQSEGAPAKVKQVKGNTALSGKMNYLADTPKSESAAKLFEAMFEKK